MAKAVAKSKKGVTARAAKKTPVQKPKPEKLLKTKAVAPKTAIARVSPSQIVKASAAGGAAAAAESNPATVPFLLMFGIFGAAISVATTLALEAFQPAARTFGARLAQRVGSTEKDDLGKAKRLQACVEDSRPAQRAVLEGVRRLLDSIAEEAAQPLANLTAEYVNNNKAPDAFFRGAARFLSELSAEELATAKDMLGRMCPEEVIDGRDEVSFLYRQGFEGRDRVGPKHLKYMRVLPADDPRRPKEKGEWTDLGEPCPSIEQHVYRVIQQMKLNGLADDPPAGGYWGVSGKENFVVPAAVLRGLKTIF